MQVEVGQGRLSKLTFSQHDFDRFAALSGDHNPIHVDPKFAAKTEFGGTVCHGMLEYGIICKVLGNLIPGAVPVEQDLMFASPLYAGEEMLIWAGVSKVQKQIGLAELETLIIKKDGEMVCKGRSLVRLPETKK